MAVNKKLHGQNNNRGGGNKPGTGNKTITGPDVTVNTGKDTSISDIVGTITEKEVPGVNVFIDDADGGLINKSVLLFITSNIDAISKNVNPFATLDIATDVTGSVMKLFRDSKYKKQFTNYVPEGEKLLSSESGKVTDAVMEIATGLFVEKSQQTRQLMYHSIKGMFTKFLNNTNDAKSKLATFAAKSKSKCIANSDLDEKEEMIMLLSKHIGSLNKVTENIDAYEDIFGAVYDDLEEDIEKLLPVKKAAGEVVEEPEEMLNLKEGKVMSVAAGKEKESKAAKEFMDGIIKVLQKCGIDVDDEGNFDKTLIDKFPELEELAELAVEFDHAFTLDTMRKFTKFLDMFEEKYSLKDETETPKEDTVSGDDEQKPTNTFTSMKLFFARAAAKTAGKKVDDKGESKDEPKSEDDKKKDDPKADDKKKDEPAVDDVIDTKVDLDESYKVLEALYGKYSFKEYKSLSDIPGYYDMKDDLKIGIASFRSMEMQRIHNETHAANTAAK